MKRSVSSSFIALFSLVFSLQAFATAYTGSGLWKSTDGKSGDYTVQANIDSQDNTVTISQTLNFGESTLALEYIIQKIDETFFNILNNANETIGEGYCLPLGTNADKICHSDSVTDNWLTESTIKITADRIYRIGSKSDIETGEKIVWKDSLEPVLVN